VLHLHGLFLCHPTQFTLSDIENKFYDYFFTGETELKLSHLASVRQKYNESISEYIRRFRDTSIDAIV
jgi:hypothetical protein